LVSGIGQGRVTNNLATFINDIDGALTVPDEETIAMLYELLDTEGIYVGASTALNVVAAVKLAEKLGKGTNSLSSLATVHILCRFDGGHDPLRWSIPIPKSTLLKGVAESQGPV